jgi:hypothetical protein
MWVQLCEEIYFENFKAAKESERQAKKSAQAAQETGEGMDFGHELPYEV